MKDPTVSTRVETSVKIDNMSLDQLDAKLSHSYEQAIAGEGRPMNEVFDDLEKGLRSSSKEFF